jgi:hypothetical protein
LRPHEAALQLELGEGVFAFGDDPSREERKFGSFYAAPFAEVAAAESERAVPVFGRVGMKRLAPLPGQVSSSPAPNRTCEFPRIRLSMRGRGHG